MHDKDDGASAAAATIAIHARAARQLVEPLPLRNHQPRWELDERARHRKLPQAPRAIDVQARPQDRGGRGGIEEARKWQSLAVQADETQQSQAAELGT